MSHAKLTSVAAVDDGVVLEVVVDLVLVSVTFVEVLVVTSGRWQWQELVVAGNPNPYRVGRTVVGRCWQDKSVAISTVGRRYQWWEGLGMLAGISKGEKAYIVWQELVHGGKRVL
ncbi:hypothetical protein Pcinc_040352, partial [Petrolisthes cinctipes]